MENTGNKKETFPAKIVRVIDEYTVVINRGKRDGIQAGQRFLVYSVDMDELSDPDTGESLGYLELVRGRGEVTHVQDAISTIRSTRRGPNVQRHVKRQGTLVLLGSESETITEVGDVAPFEYAEEGDLAKPI